MVTTIQIPESKTDIYEKLSAELGACQRCKTLKSCGAFDLNRRAAMEYMPKVLQAVAGENFTIYLYFSDGSVRLYDAKPVLERGGVFEPMRDKNFFREHLTVLNDTAAWDVNGDFDPCSCIDLDPIELYESSVVVADPLETAS